MYALQYEHLQGWFLGYARKVENGSWAGSARTSITDIITCVAMLLDVFFSINYDTVTNHGTRLYTTIEEEPTALKGTAMRNRLCQDALPARSIA